MAERQYGDYPVKLTSLHDVRYASMRPEQLRDACSRVFSELRVTQAQADNLEQATRSQAQSDMWFDYRRGRVTASLFGKVANKSRPQNVPALDSVLQTYSVGWENQAGCNWGLTHEDDALRAYEAVMRRKHNGFRTCASGLVINPNYPHLGATPDAFVECSCGHGKGVVEVKCPFKHRYAAPCTVHDDFFCLYPHSKSPGGCPPSLKKDHNFYYQVQGQMAVCNVDYCDFVCWTQGGVHIERVPFNRNFWLMMKNDLDDFFVGKVLPRLLTKQC